MKSYPDHSNTKQTASPPSMGGLSECKYVSSLIWFSADSIVSLHWQGKREGVSLFSITTAPQPSLKDPQEGVSKVTHSLFNN